MVFNGLFRRFGGRIQQMEDERYLPPEEFPNGIFSSDGFEVVRSQFFSSSSEPVLSFGRLKMWVNSVCLRKFQKTDYIQTLVNSNTKTLILRPSREDARDALPWCSAGSEKRKPRQLSCPIFFAKIYALMEWDPDCRYRLTGKYLRENEEQLLAFDLRSAEAFCYSGDTARRYTPYFPADWRERFGMPAAEHRMEPLIHVFQEYVIFELETPIAKLGTPAPQEAKGDKRIWQTPASENYIP